MWSSQGWCVLGSGVLLCWTLCVPCVSLLWVQRPCSQTWEGEKKLKFLLLVWRWCVNRSQDRSW